MRSAYTFSQRAQWQDLHPRKRQRVPSTSLDTANGRGIIFISPPIRFRIEWAGSQRIVTALWQSAHFDFPRFSACLIYIPSVASNPYLNNAARDVTDTTA